MEQPGGPFRAAGDPQRATEHIDAADRSPSCTSIRGTRRRSSRRDSAAAPPRPARHARGRPATRPSRTCTCRCRSARGDSSSRRSGRASGPPCLNHQAIALSGAVGQPQQRKEETPDAQDEGERQEQGCAAAGSETPGARTTRVISDCAAHSAGVSCRMDRTSKPASSSTRCSVRPVKWTTWKGTCQWIQERPNTLRSALAPFGALTQRRPPAFSSLRACRSKSRGSSECSRTFERTTASYRRPGANSLTGITCTVKPRRRASAAATGFGSSPSASHPLRRWNRSPRPSLQPMSRSRPDPLIVVEEDVAVDRGPDPVEGRTEEAAPEGCVGGAPFAAEVVMAFVEAVEFLLRRRRRQLLEPARAADRDRQAPGSPKRVSNRPDSRSSREPPQSRQWREVFVEGVVSRQYNPDISGGAANRDRRAPRASG